jgi:hypothetical protein
MSNQLSPGVHFMSVYHDDHCQTLVTGAGSDCDCDPTTEVHRDEARFLKTATMNRASRRKAAREAEKAIRKAQKQTGSKG